MLIVNDILELANEPWVYLCQFVYPVDGISLFQSLCDSENTKVGRVGEFLVKVVELGMVVSNKTMHALTNHSQSFLYKFLERPANRHDFSNRLHA